MSPTGPAQPTPSSWEEHLGAIDDEDLAVEYARGKVHEPLAEAHARAKRVLALEQAREKPRPKVVAHAKTSVASMEQTMQTAMGMWH